MATILPLTLFSSWVVARILPLARFSSRAVALKLPLFTNYWIFTRAWFPSYTHFSCIYCVFTLGISLWGGGLCPLKGFLNCLRAVTLECFRLYECRSAR